MRKTAAILAALSAALVMAACADSADSGSTADKVQSSSAQQAEDSTGKAKQGSPEKEIIDDVTKEDGGDKKLPVNSLINYDIEILGNKVTLPCKMSELKGLKVDPESLSYDEEFTPANTYAELTFEDEEGKDHVLAYAYFKGNYEEDPENAEIICIEIFTNSPDLPDDVTAVNYNGITMNSTKESVISAFGEPANKSRSGLLRYYFEPAEGVDPQACYVSFTTDEIDGMQKVTEIELACQRPMYIDPEE